MLWAISAAAVAGIAAAGVFAGLWWSLRCRNACLSNALVRKEKVLIDVKRDAEHWKHEACLHLERERVANEQAQAFEESAKLMEEHLAAERGRADRLAGALRAAENHAEELQQQIKTLLDRNGTKEMPPKDISERMRREFENIMRYNGTEEGQVELNG